MTHSIRTSEPTSGYATLTRERLENIVSNARDGAEAAIRLRGKLGLLDLYPEAGLAAALRNHLEDRVTERPTVAKRGWWTPDAEDPRCAVFFIPADDPNPNHTFAELAGEFLTFGEPVEAEDQDVWRGAFGAAMLG